MTAYFGRKCSTISSSFSHIIFRAICCRVSARFTDANRRGATDLHEGQKGALERYQPHYPDKAWGTMFLKTLNNLGVCYAKRQQPHDRNIVFKTLSTAQGQFGSINYT